MAVTTATVIAAAGLALAAGSAYVGYRQQQKVADQQERQAKASNRRQRRQELRQAQIAAATIENTGAQVGGGMGSGVAGGMSSVQSQAGANIGFINSMEASSNRISRYSRNATLAGNVGQVGVGAFQFGVQRGAFQGGGTPPQAKQPNYPNYGPPGT